MKSTTNEESNIEYTKIYNIIDSLYTKIVLVIDKNTYSKEQLKYFLELYMQVTDVINCRMEPDYLDIFAIRSEYIVKLFDNRDNSYSKKVKSNLYDYITKRNDKKIIEIIKNPIYDTDDDYYKDIKKKTLITGAELISNTNVICPNCKIANVYYSMKQRRSADEGSDIDYVCLNTNCGNKWKVRG